MTSVQPNFPPSSMAAPTVISKEDREALLKKLMDQNVIKSNASVDTVEIAKPKKKSFWKGLSSFFLTGSGQMFDGRFKDGFKQLGIEFGLGALGGAVGAIGVKNFMKTVQTGAKTPYGWYASLAISAGLGIAAIVNKVKSIKDAYNCGQK